jgi:hypothetical protein
MYFTGRRGPQDGASPGSFASPAQVGGEIIALVVGDLGLAVARQAARTVHSRLAERRRLYYGFFVSIVVIFA